MTVNPLSSDWMTWTWTRMQRGQAGIDSIMFRAVADQALAAGFYLRERDLSYFGIEEWFAPPHIGSFIGEGELPCIYSISAGAEVVPTTPAVIFPLVDLVFRITGSGVGIRMRARDVQSGLIVDLRTGSRVRYLISRFSCNESVYWVERTEAGRSRGSPGGSGSMFGDMSNVAAIIKTGNQFEPFDPAIVFKSKP